MALKSPYDPNDQVYEHLVQSSDVAIPPDELPSMHILHSLPVRHQGERPTCAAFTGASIAEYHFQSEGRLSPEFIYYHRMTPRGMYGRAVFEILKKHGIATEDEFSYGTEDYPSEEVYQVAKSRRLSGFSRIHTIDGVKHALVENGPVYIALPLYNNGLAFWKREDGSIDSPCCGHHAVAVEGYDTNGFFFRNSWGPEWGNNGCGYLPFSDFCRVVEAWVGIARRNPQIQRSTAKTGSAKKAMSVPPVRISIEATVLSAQKPWYVRLFQAAKEYILNSK